MSMRQGWRDLTFFHWELPPEAVRPAVPPPLELDLRDGRAWVGIVAFEVKYLKPRVGPFGLSFLETNLRTYVRFHDVPAIWFMTLDAASRLAVAGARFAYGLAYRHARMRLARDGERIAYDHRRTGDGAGFHARCRVGAPLGTAPPGSLEHFLVERYRLFVVRNGRVVATEVSHPPYALRAAAVDELSESICAPAGLPPAAGRPHAVYSPGVDVRVLAPRTVPPGP
jgi:uncharacterized protein YqjF (DUF2071 family)